MSDLEKFKGELPNKENYYSSLTGSGINESNERLPRLVFKM